MSELVDERTGTRWTSHIVTDISRHCAGHFDRGQASWMSPWLSLPLYEAWRQRTRLSRRLDELGIRGFRQLVAGLPDDAREAIPDLLARLAIPKPHIERFLLAELFSVAGGGSGGSGAVGTSPSGRPCKPLDSARATSQASRTASSPVRSSATGGGSSACQAR